MNANDAREELDRLREAIGRVDEVIQRLMSQRAKYATELGKIEAVTIAPWPAPAASSRS